MLPMRLMAINTAAEMKSTTDQKNRGTNGPGFKVWNPESVYTLSNRKIIKNNAIGKKFIFLFIKCNMWCSKHIKHKSTL